MRRAKLLRPAPPVGQTLAKPIVIRGWRLFFWVYALFIAPLSVALAIYLLFDMAYSQFNGWILLLGLALFTLAPLSAYGLIPTLRMQRQVLLEIRNEGIWSPHTGAILWQQVRFLGFRSYMIRPTRSSVFLEVFVSSETVPVYRFDLDDTNIYWIARLKRRLQRLTTVMVYRERMRRYQPVGSIAPAMGSVPTKAASSKLKGSDPSAHANRGQRRRRGRS